MALAFRLTPNKKVRAIAWIFSIQSKNLKGGSRIASPVIWRMASSISKSRTCFPQILEHAMVMGPVTEADVFFGYDWSQKQGRRS